MVQLNEIKSILSKNKLFLKNEYNITEIAVFGSYVNGAPREDSDVDILVEFSEVPDLFTFVSIKYKLEDLLGLKVDLIRKEALRKELHYVLDEAVTI